MDWTGFRPPSTWRQSGGEWAGPCPITGAGKAKAWANPDAELLGCRECAPGGLRGEAFTAHARALGIVASGGAPNPRRRNRPQKPTGMGAGSTNAPGGVPLVPDGSPSRTGESLKDSPFGRHPAARITAASAGRQCAGEP